MRKPPGGSRKRPLKATRHRRPARTAYGPGLREAPSSLVFATGVRRDVARSSTVAAGLVGAALRRSARVRKRRGGGIRLALCRSAG